jgi:Fis family transcriptional regulator
MNKYSLSKNFLHLHVSQAIHEYFSTLGDEQHTTNLYNLVLTEVERPLLEIVMHYAQGNQSKAADWLGLHRSTLKKLLLKYDLISKPT